jgi:uncharacterized protein YegL
MGLNDAIEAIPRKTMVLFFLVDTSGSMSGSKIGAVNTAIEEVIPELRSLSSSNADALIKAAALEFNNGARWTTPAGPEDVENFRWQYLDASGSTDMGEAFKKLNEKLSTKAFMKEAAGSFAPAFFLLSDGEPTDDFDGGLWELKQNNWFKHGIKVAIAIGDDANKARLAEFTGSIESVLDAHNRAVLKKMIKFVSVRASQVASKSVQVSDMSTADQAGADAETTAAANSGSAGPGIKQQELNAQLAEIAAETQSGAGEDEW